MTLSYRTLRGEGAGVYEEKKSVFIGAANRAGSEAEALAFLALINERRRDASHIVFAYTCGDKGLVKRYGEAGEPRGTAGPPVLEVIEKAGLTDVVVVVTRYFGGTLLGAAGLIRSYGKAASLAVNDAGIVEKTLARRVAVLVGYQYYDAVRYYLDTCGYAVDNVAYGMDTELTVTVPYAEADALSLRVSEITSGSAVVEPAGELYVEVGS